MNRLNLLVHPLYDAWREFEISPSDITAWTKYVPAELSTSSVITNIVALTMIYDAYIEMLCDIPEDELIVCLWDTKLDNSMDGRPMEIIGEDANKLLRYHLKLKRKLRQLLAARGAFIIQDMPVDEIGPLLIAEFYRRYPEGDSRECTVIVRGEHRELCVEIAADQAAKFGFGTVTIDESYSF